MLKIDREAIRRIEYAAPGKPAVVVTRNKEQLADGGTGDEKLSVIAPKIGPGAEVQAQRGTSTHAGPI